MRRGPSTCSTAASEGTGYSRLSSVTDMMDSLEQVRELTDACLGCYASVPHAGRGYKLWPIERLATASGRSVGRLTLMAGGC